MKPIPGKGSIAMWGPAEASGNNRPFVGFRPAKGGERSQYRPHVGAKEVAKHDAREQAAHRDWISSVEAEILEKNQGVYIV